MYAPIGKDPGTNWVGFQAIHHIRFGPDWHNVVRPQTRIFSDLTSGQFPQISWVIPSLSFSDHPGGSRKGQDWVTDVVNAIGASQYWSSTAIFIVWDDWGGFYDHVPPLYEDYDGLGFRVPLIVVSPYAKTNYVSHVQYEFGSILQFAEDTFGLGRLAASDTRATSLIPDCFTFGGAAKPFHAFPSTVRPADFDRVAREPGTLLPGSDRDGD